MALATSQLARQGKGHRHSNSGLIVPGLQDSVVWGELG